MTSELHSTATPRARAVLVAVQLPGVTTDEVEASLDELARLATTLGLRPVARLTQRGGGTGSATLLGEGKLRELAELTGGSGVVPSGAERRRTGAKPRKHEDDRPEPAEERSDRRDRATVVVVDHDLSPSQLRNLEGATGAQVLDRSSVILSIFQAHARTREARLQVELARLAYLVPRLRETGGGGDRQRAVVGVRGGAGESALERDKRKVRDRMAELRQELEAVQREAATRRARRQSWNTIALVGYTNAGKSSLMRVLTGSQAHVADQLFATLDTTVRTLHPETRPRLLVTDTVGFIKKLPHDLVASFRSTLDEAREAALLLHVVDASDPSWRSQLQVTREVLADIGAGDRPSILVLNKADRLGESAVEELAQERPDAFIGSAFRPDDVARLHARIVEHFERTMEEAELVVPHHAGRIVHEAHETCRVLSESHEEGGTRLAVRAPAEAIGRLRTLLADESRTPAGSSPN